MRSSPFKQGIWVLLAAALMAVPLYYLTNTPVPERVFTEESSRNDLVECVLLIRSSSMPQGLVVKYKDQVIVEWGKDGENYLLDEKMVKLPIVMGEKISLHVTAEWKADGARNDPGDQAVELTLEPDGMPERSVTRWSSGETLNDIYLFAWP